MTCSLQHCNATNQTCFDFVSHLFAVAVAFKALVVMADQ